mmetsp:Transcript_33345/g.111281  ORF Transcript_33345/g.111281 Transcript_33345/m.111281 type:complete len:235 (-) Transcript_33345:2-706(-)
MTRDDPRLYPRLGIRLADLGADARELVGDALARERERVRQHAVARNRRALLPHCVHQVARHQPERQAAACRPPVGKVDGDELRVGADGTLRQVRPDPLLEVGDPRLMRAHQHPLCPRELLGRLHKVAAVCPHERLVGSHKSGSGAAGEASQPLAPLVRLGDVLAAVCVARRHKICRERVRLEQAAHASNLESHVERRKVLAERRTRAEAARARLVRPAERHRGCCLRHSVYLPM